MNYEIDNQFNFYIQENEMIERQDKNLQGQGNLPDYSIHG